MAGTIYLLILVAAFIGIVIWVFSRKRKARFEVNARIPLDHDRVIRHDDAKRDDVRIPPMSSEMPAEGV